MTSLKKAPSPSENENVIVLCKRNSDLNSFGLSSTELAYAQNEFEKKNKKSVCINQFRRLVVLQLLDKKEKEYQTLEAARKAGDKIATYLNDHKIESVVIVDAIGDAKAILALAAG